MSVGVDETGDDRASPEVEHRRPGTMVSPDLFGGSDLEDDAVRDRHGLGNRGIRIGRVNDPARDQQVGRLLGGQPRGPESERAPQEREAARPRSDPPAYHAIP